RLVLSITIFFLCYYGVAQTSYWKKVDSNTHEVQQQLTRLKIKDAKVFSLEKDLFTNTLKGGNTKRQQQVVSFPDENGFLRSFAIQESPVLSPELSEKYPEIKSFVGHSLNNNNDRIRFSVSQNGIQSMIIHANGKNATYMQKVSPTTNDYMVYDREWSFGMPSDFICETKAKIETEG